MFDLIRADSNALLSSLILGILISLLSLSTVIFSQKLIDEILPQQEIQRLQLGLVLVLMVLLGRCVLIYLRSFSIIKQAKDFNSRVVELFFDRLLHLPKIFFDSKKVGELIARMNDTRRIQLAVSTISGNIIIDILLIIASFGFVFSYSVVLGLFITSSALVFGFVISILSPKLALTQREVMRHYALAEGFYVDAITGINQIKSGAKEMIFKDLNSSIFQKFQLKQFELGKLGMKYGLLSEVLSVVYIIGTIGISSLFVLSEQLSTGEMIAIISMVGNVVPALARITASNIQFQEAKVAFDRMFEFAFLEPEQSSHSLEGQLSSIEELNVVSVSYRFPGQPYLFRNISFNAKIGTITAIVGESGSGKSTLFSIIEMFYRYNEGSITVNDRSLASLPISSWRQSVSVVHQTVKIFNGSIAFNIAFSNLQDDIERVEKMCKYYGFDKFFDRFPEKYDTIIGEEGINISGGQRKMLAFARALFNKPKLLLIDELTSELDKNAEDFVISVLLRLKHSMPIIMVTHQPQIAKITDNIYVLENGSISKNGSHEELIRTENFYSRVYKSYIKQSTT